MKTWSVPLGKILGVEVRIHLTFAMLLLFLLVDISRAGAGTLESQAERVFALVALVLGSVVLHDLGHILAARYSGVGVKGIMLMPIGGMMVPDPNQPPENLRNLVRETRIALAGPLVSFVITLLTLLVQVAVLHSRTLSARPLITIHDLSRSLFWINFFIFALNLLPAFPLDGGRILRAWLGRKMEFQQATRRAVNIGHGFAAVFMFVGVLVSPWLMLLGLFMFMAAQIEERTLLFQSVVEAVRMEDVMLTQFSTLSPADTLEDALSAAVHSLQDDFPVVRGSDLVGVINRQTIVDSLRRDGNGYVQGAMNKAFEVASRTESLASAFRKLTSRGLTLIPVVDQERLVGIVTLQNLMHSMGLLAESRRLRREGDQA